jgi:hypothetical protein
VAVSCTAVDEVFVAAGGGTGAPDAAGEDEFLIEEGLVQGERAPRSGPAVIELDLDHQNGA